MPVPLFNKEIRTTKEPKVWRNWIKQRTLMNLLKSPLALWLKLQLRHLTNVAKGSLLESLPSPLYKHSTLSHSPFTYRMFLCGPHFICKNYLLFGGYFCEPKWKPPWMERVPPYVGLYLGYKGHFEWIPHFATSKIYMCSVRGCVSLSPM